MYVIQLKESQQLYVGYRVTLIEVYNLGFDFQVHEGPLESCNNVQSFRYRLGRYLSIWPYQVSIYTQKLELFQIYVHVNSYYIYDMCDIDHLNNWIRGN